eukprot:PhF_6_TR19084/c0_g1_i2/m.28067
MHGICYLLLIFITNIVNIQSTTVQVQYPESKLPKGSSLSLRGDQPPLSWDSGVLLTQTGKDTFALTLNFTSQKVCMKVLVDDKYWEIGSNECFVNVSPSSVLQMFPFFQTSKGQYSILTKSLYSPQLKNKRPLVIYTPPSYFENTYKPYTNVLIMHDGQNLFNKSTSAFGVAWEIQKTADRLIVAGSIPDDLIIIGIYNVGENRTYEYTYSPCDVMPDCDGVQGVGGGADLYLDFIQDTVVPYVLQQMPRIHLAGRGSGLYIGGSSLGGILSCYASWTRPTVFSKAICMSSSFWWNGEDFRKTVMPQHTAPSTGSNVFYADSGNAGPDNDDVVQTGAVVTAMQSYGFVLNQTVWHYIQDGGQHSEQYWGERFWVPLTELFPSP